MLASADRLQLAKAGFALLQQRHPPAGREQPACRLFLPREQGRKRVGAFQ